MTQHEAFENWVKKTGSFTDWSRYGDGYARPLVERTWQAWCAAAASEWQPIETAPKDGTILLSISGTTQRVVYWDDGAFFKGWFVQCTESGGGSFFDPTHWRSLPPPPAYDE